jgi:aminomethyltransferase
MLGRQSAAAPADPALSRTPLCDLHVSLGARMGGFAGYSMPINYPSGVIAEHLHTRAAASLFDVSHMGQAVLAGPDAARRLETLVPGDIMALVPGGTRYTLLLNADGHILDDLIVTRLPDEGSRERLFLVVNAGRKQADFEHISASLPDCALTVLAHRALLALQGPLAAAILSRHLSPAAAKEVTAMPFMSAQTFERDGLKLHISRAGYTGEDGFEISLDDEAAQNLAQELLGDPDVRPAGLGARDSLRLEAGLCLCGHDIGEETGPVEAGLLWTVAKHRRKNGGFLGHKEVEKTIARGPSRRRAGFLIDGKALAREGAMIVSATGQTIGAITSGGFAPSLGQPAAMGYVDRAFAVPGTQVALAARGKELAAKIVPLPFVPHRYFRGP